MLMVQFIRSTVLSSNRSHTHTSNPSWTILDKPPVPRVSDGLWPSCSFGSASRPFCSTSRTGKPILCCGDGSFSVFGWRKHDHPHAQTSLLSAWHLSTSSALVPSSSFGLPTRMESIPSAPTSLRFSLSSLRRLQH